MSLFEDAAEQENYSFTWSLNLCFESLATKSVPLWH